MVERNSCPAQCRRPRTFRGRTLTRFSCLRSSAAPPHYAAVIPPQSDSSLTSMQNMLTIISNALCRITGRNVVSVFRSFLAVSGANSGTRLTLTSPAASFQWLTLLAASGGGLLHTCNGRGMFIVTLSGTFTSCVVAR